MYFLFTLFITGKPAILLHTRDGGKQFERIPLSPKLPGEPVSIVSTGVSKAEMITSQGTFYFYYIASSKVFILLISVFRIFVGAIYTTSNGGLNWKAQVKETIDATLNRYVCFCYTKFSNVYI